MVNASKESPECADTRGSGNDVFETKIASVMTATAEKTEYLRCGRECEETLNLLALKFNIITPIWVINISA